MLVFGGWHGAYFNDLWSYDATSNVLLPLTPSGPTPPAREHHTAVWDAAGNRMFVFGGQGSDGSYLSDLWSYDASSNSWAQLTPGGSPPAPRYLHTAVWDAAGGRMLVLWGYNNSSGFLNELWSYQAAANTWVPLAPAGTLPAARAGHRAIWDAAASRMLVFAGNDGQYYYNDLWSYGATTNTWVPLTPSGPPPAVRWRHTAVWDAVGNRMLVFGGRDGSGPGNDLWSYQAATNSWTELSPGGYSRYDHTAVWDTVGNRMLIFAGDPSRLGRDLWSYQGASNTWAQLAPSGMPPTSYRTAVWDAVANRMLVLGVKDDDEPTGFWSYQAASNTWLTLAPSGSRPGATSGFTAVWDAASSQMLVFGGSEFFHVDHNDLWSYQAASNAWLKLTPGGTLPARRHRHTAVWDGGSRRMLVFGGETGFGSSRNDLWSYQAASNSWVQLTPTGALPPARSGHTAVWDAVGNRMLVFGGFDSSSVVLNDLWSYQATTNSWVQLTPNGSLPMPRSRHTAVWAGAGNRMLVFGGSATGGSLNDLWSYDATSNSWAQLAPGGALPAPQTGHTAVWDAASSRMLVFGGDGLWIYQSPLPPPPTPTPTRTPTATPSPTPTITPTPNPCLAAARVRVEAAPNGDGRLRVSVSAAHPSVPLQSVAFRADPQILGSALIDTATQTGQAPPFTLPLPAGTQGTLFYVRPAIAGQGATVPLTVTDACGAWPTFVGGGPAVFAGGGPGPAAPTPGATPPTATPPPATATRTPSATSTLRPAAPSATPTPAAVCAPRPSVAVATTALGGGRLQVTITAPASANDRLLALRFGVATNARIEAGGQSGTGGFSVSLSPGTQQTTFVVTRVTAGQGATVPLVVVDACGEWPTVVGGGPTAF
jgi:N-acetylneuraminic acid mutarotase